MPIRAWDPLIYSSTPAASRARERLDLIDRLVDWGQFDRYLRWLDAAPTGRWPHRPLTLFKSLLLEQWFSMGAAEFDFDMADRACYRRFLGLADGVAAPPHVTICAFRRLLLERDVASELEAELKRQFSDLEMMMEAGSLGQLGSADGADEVLSLNIDARPQEWVALERVFLDYWRSRAGGRNAPHMNDIKLHEVPETIKPYLTLTRVLPDGGFRHEYIGTGVETANEGSIDGSTVDDRLRRNLRQYGHAGVYAEIDEAYRSVVTRKCAVRTSAYYFNARHTKCRLWTIQAPLCDSIGAVSMLFGIYYILPVLIN